jgi:hypothetical protein
MSRIRVLAGAVALAGALAVLNGCTSGGGKPSAGSPTGAAGSTGPSATASAAASTASFPDQAEAYTRTAIAAWRSHDATVLGSLNASSDKVFATLDAGNYDNRFDTLYTCEGAAGSTYCTYYNTAGDTLRLKVNNELLGKAHALVGGELIPITFPTDYKAYAQETLTAWQDHNTAAVALLTGKTGDSAFASVPASARSAPGGWSFDHTEGATGHELFFFRDPAGDTIGFQFSNPDFVSPPANRHGLVEQIAYTPHS